MTRESARNQLERLDNTRGTCVPSTIDSMLPVSELPAEYYDAAQESFRDPQGSHNKYISYILKEFFKVEPMPGTAYASIAKFNAFGASPQSYMPDAPYEFPDINEDLRQHGVTDQQLRFIELLDIARHNTNLILFTNNTDSKDREHVSGLEMIDASVDTANAKYVIRDHAEIQTERLYKPFQLAGISQKLGTAETSRYAPLPTVTRPYFPDAQSSYELLILPPDPKLTNTSY